MRRVALLIGVVVVSAITQMAGRSAVGVSGGSQLATQTSRSWADSAFYSHVLPASRVAVGWTGRVSGCQAGTFSSAARTAAQDVVNTYRSLGRVRSVSFASGLNGMAQQAALMMHAANAISHDPPSSWPCWTRSGATGASRSDLSLASDVRASIPAFMSEPGSANADVGHRRWILDPRQSRMGFGQTSRSAALYVLDTATWSWPSGAATFQAWPPAGYFPVALEPSSRWSFTSARSSVDLSHAVVSVSGPSGAIGVTLHRGKGYVTFDLASRISRSSARDRTYTVTVSRARRSGTTLSPIRYKVVLVPLRRLAATASPSVTSGTSGTRAEGTRSGGATPGTVLTASQGSWSPSREVGTYSFQWLRDGVAISGATSSRYTSTTADSGRTITVRVVARAWSGFYLPGAATSPPPA